MLSYSSRVSSDILPGIRLDRYIAEDLKILSRSQIKARQLKARLNGKDVKVSRLLRGGEYLELSWNEGESLFLVPEELPLDIIYEDERVIVVNKAQGMVVHPGAGNRQGTLANALLWRRLERKKGGNITEGYRPGIVHRLDKDTSGLIIAAWDDEAHAFLSEQFKARKVLKSYAAFVHGCPKDETGLIDKRIIRSKANRKLFTVTDNGGRPSLTYYKVIRNYGDYSLLLLRPKTGRTHQIRVHLKYLGNPIIGDPLYGHKDRGFSSFTLMLHAKRLSLVLPSSGGEALLATCKWPCSEAPSGQGLSIPSTFRAPFPERFKRISQKPVY